MLFRSRLIGGTSLIIHYFFSFVKNFFQSFLTSDPLCIVSNFFSLPHSEAFVKNFFQKFLKLASAISAATILGYHILWLLSSVFFISLCGAVLTAPTALLEYQIIPRLSTPFSNFLHFFNIHYYTPLSQSYLCAF